MRPSWLDAMVEQFQHRWETNAQFRAMVSGVAGLVMVVGLCAVLGVSATFANAIGGSLGGGSGNSFISQAGPNAQSTDVAFPMTTLTPWPAPNIPGAAPIPASQTPQPSPTSQPTPTDVPVPTGQPGGGGNGGGGGGGGSITGTNPAPLKGGQPGSVLVQTKHPNTQVLINIVWPSGVSDFPAGQGSTDSSGNGSIQINAVPVGCNGAVQIHALASDGSQFSTSLPCTP